jgi:hypothetical protein
VVVPILTSLRIRTVNPLGSLGGRRSRSGPASPPGILAAGWGLCLLVWRFRQMSSPVPIATTSADTWVQQRSVKHGLKVTQTASGVVRHEQRPWHGRGRPPRSKRHRSLSQQAYKHSARPCLVSLIAAEGSTTNATSRAEGLTTVTRQPPGLTTVMRQPLGLTTVTRQLPGKWRMRKQPAMQER